MRAKSSFSNCLRTYLTVFGDTEKFPRAYLWIRLPIFATAINVASNPFIAAFHLRLKINPLVNLVTETQKLLDQEFGLP